MSGNGKKNGKGGAGLRSHEWFGKADRDGFIHRSWMRSEGFAPDVFDGRPVIGICNSWSELTSCNVHLRRVAESVKRGVWEAGGWPLEFPTISLGETYMRPTTMLFRNLMAMDVEESLRANPIDGVVLLSGCDKTTPAQMMGAASVDLPTLQITGGPMLNGKWRGTDIGSGTAVWQLSEEMRGGRLTLEEFFEAEAGQSRSNGHCMTMGTASTMASMSEALGLAPSGNAAIPAVDSRRYALAQLAGRRIVEMVREDLRMSKVVTRESFENAIRVNAAIGGSTNAVIHLLALAGRLGVPLELDDWDRLGHDLPLLVNLMPSGQYLMEDFYYAGGLPVVIKELAENGCLHSGARTVSGKTIGEDVAGAKNWNEKVIRPFANPLKERAGIAVLKGSLAPLGAVIKPSAATPSLMKHSGRAVVFENIEDFHARIDDPNLDVDENCVLVLKGVGPKGYPGMPEAGNMPLPPKILAKGITDMVRVSDGRMSGTAYGTVCLHTSPEAADGGPLGLVRSGDRIELDVGNRRLDLAVSQTELDERRRTTHYPTAQFERGYGKLYVEHVLGAERGADLDFLVGHSGALVARESH
ncbi:MAG: dihydroxy-acid dehydratase [Candidatus Eremiobacteraeota bacterium]|nr:dihydroxy-acid dehydratase [Candidatus Eremiobacteraeota bacterium]